MARVSDISLMSIDPGAASPGAFQHVAYKGGSDIGIFNLTTMVTTQRGSHICFSATLNDPKHAIDETSFGMAYATALNYLAGL